ncbi:MAG: AtpZ/AtpI family protein [Anaerolineae bacterium]|nr:AtpZ/AtpI family protein [Anaerolineae bacterium]
MSEPSKEEKQEKLKGFAASYAVGYSLAIKFLFILICPIASGLACGIWLDRYLATAPWLMLILTGLSLSFAFYAVYRVAMNLQQETN